MKWNLVLRLLSVFACLSTLKISGAQTPSWTMQTSGTTAGLRGIHSVDGKVAWASGAEGTVLRTLDGGEHWTKCTIPDAATDGVTLDFRGVQAWDATTAIVMASGPGDKSRLYKTTDGCKSWKLLLKNTEKDGFFDSFWLNAIYGEGMLVGDPVDGQFTVLQTSDGGISWKLDSNHSLHLHGISLAAFAASNSSLGRADRGMGDTRGPGIDYFPGFVTGGKGGAFLFERWLAPSFNIAHFRRKRSASPANWEQHKIPIASGSDSSGAFALALRYTGSPCSDCGFGAYWIPVAVGGDYTKPNESSGTAAYSLDAGQTWSPATKPPHGYRSSVAWSPGLKAWITAGANGSDISRDDGATWSPIDDGNWNALSLPFAVGPKGRIARLQTVKNQTVQ